DVVFPAQWCGIEQAGTAYRMDTVPITLKKVVEAPKGILPDDELVRRILEKVRVIKAQKIEDNNNNNGLSNLERKNY
ncbi:MAG: hypothetical protein LBE76_04045, partial [Nitrososphaerota archaeon]|nr:hypothetical protein [Nitrososphaerota archaeon]